MGREFVIVGGGIYGVYVAWELAKRDADVLLFEKADVANEASGGPGKRGVRANGRDPRELPLMRVAYDIWPTLSNSLGTDIGYERSGGLELIERELPEIGATTTASAPAQAWLQRQHGVPTELLDAEEVRELEPAVSDDVVGAIYCEKDGVVDQTAVTKAVARAAEREGAEIRTGTSVDSLDCGCQRVTAVTTSDGDTVEIERKLLLLSNSHAPSFLETELGVSLPIWNFLPQVILTEPLDEMPINHLIGHSHRLLAMKGLPDDRLMITGGWPAAITPGQDAGEPIPEQVDLNVEQATAVFPFVEELEIDEVVTSHLESCTIDHLPVIDSLTVAENLIVGTGWTGHGFAISPAVSELLAEWAVTGDRPDLLSPFSIRRFEPGAR